MLAERTRAQIVRFCYLPRKYKGIYFCLWQQGSEVRLLTHNMPLNYARAVPIHSPPRRRCSQHFFWIKCSPRSLDQAYSFQYGPGYERIAMKFSIGSRIPHSLWALILPGFLPFGLLNIPFSSGRSRCYLVLHRKWQYHIRPVGERPWCLCNRDRSFPLCSICSRTPRCPMNDPPTMTFLTITSDLG